MSSWSVLKYCTALYVPSWSVLTYCTALYVPGWSVLTYCTALYVPIADLYSRTVLHCMYPAGLYSRTVLNCMYLVFVLDKGVSRVHFDGAHTTGTCSRFVIHCSNHNVYSIFSYCVHKSAKLTFPLNCIEGLLTMLACCSSIHSGRQ